ASRLRNNAPRSPPINTSTPLPPGVAATDIGSRSGITLSAIASCWNVGPPDAKKSGQCSTAPVPALDASNPTVHTWLTPSVSTSCSGGVSAGSASDVQCGAAPEVVGTSSCQAAALLDPPTPPEPTSSPTTTAVVGWLSKNAIPFRFAAGPGTRNES